MVETMPGGLSSITIRPMRAQTATRSPFTFSTQVVDGMGAMWTASATVPVQKNAGARQWRAFFLRLNGLVGTFRLGDPAHCTPAGTASGTGNRIDGTVRSSTVAATLNGTLLAGDYFSCNDRLYSVKDDSADGVLKIWPPLRDAGGPIVLENPTGLFRLADPNQGAYEIAPGCLYSFEFQCMEAL